MKLFHIIDYYSSISIIGLDLGSIAIIILVKSKHGDDFLKGTIGSFARKNAHQAVKLAAQCAFKNGGTKT